MKVGVVEGFDQTKPWFRDALIYIDNKEKLG